MTPKIVVVGSFNVDLTAYMQRLPQPGETVMGQRFVTGPGGKGSNQAVAASRLGADVVFVGRLGNDEFAEIALQLWREENIDSSYVSIDHTQSTGVAPIWVEDSGQNAIVVISGANASVDRNDVDRASHIIAEADVVIAQHEIPTDTVFYALQIAKSYNIPTIFNPAPASSVPKELMTFADFITPNQTELALLTDKGLTKIEQGRLMMATNQQTVVVTLGEQGAQWITRQETEIIPPYQVDVTDTSGAGDAFNGGLAVALAEKQPISKAVQFANAVAALSVTRPGTAKSMPTRKEVENFLRNYTG